MSIKEARRILVIGCSGGGKTTFTKKLSTMLNLPTIHLDTHFWRSGWTSPPRVEWRKTVEQLVEQEQWIMDGTFDSTFDLRFPKADLIIILKQPKLLCLWRAFIRMLTYRNEDHRPDLPEGCPEKFDLSFYHYIWTYNRVHNPIFEENIDRFQKRESTIFLHGDKQIKSFIDALPHKIPN